MIINKKLFDITMLKFMLVGIVNTLVGAAIMFGLYNLAGCSYWLSSGTSYFFATILSFFLNKYFTFKIKEWSVKMVINFILTIFISYLLAFGLAKPIVHYLLANYSIKLRDNIALLTGEILFTAFNYLGQRFFAFKSKKESLPPFDQAL
jgi:putative flippase GtrA